MTDDSKIIRWGVILAAVILVVRIVLEQAGAPEKVCFFFGVAWLYFVFPVLFALAIRARNAVHPFKSLLKDLVLFALYTRAMVMVTYMLAYIFRWKPHRFAYPGGNVGENVGVWTGLLLIPVRNVFIWVVMATILGTIIGSITLLLKRKGSPPAA
ncbi:MAG TPA: hypothetical protein VMG30_16430 [Acidobacteriota bacterium]|nr:hypothetical protein [Acidobacteriota bacterium]